MNGAVNHYLASEPLGIAAKVDAIGEHERGMKPNG